MMEDMSFYISHLCYNLVKIIYISLVHFWRMRRSMEQDDKSKFEGEIYVLTKEEGGRHTPFFKGYKPQFYIRTTDVTGEVELPEGTEMVMPGDTVSLKIKLSSNVAMEEGMRFAIREGGRTVGAGIATKIIK